MKLTALNLITLAGWGLFAVWCVREAAKPRMPLWVSEEPGQAGCGNVRLPGEGFQATNGGPDGKRLFQMNCASCHNPMKDATGPALRDVARRVPDRAWMYRWVHDPAAVLASGDPYAKALFKRWNKTRMTAFPQLKNEEIDAILGYTMRTELRFLSKQHAAKRALAPIALAAFLLYACSNSSQAPPAPPTGTDQPAKKPDGQLLFVENCAACHQRDRDATGPALAGVMTRWEGDTTRLRAFIRNNEKAAENGDSRAQELRRKWDAAMPQYTDFTDRDIDAILGYIEAR